MHKFTRLCATALAVVALSAPALAQQSQAPASDESKPQTQQMQDKTAPQMQNQGAQTEDKGASTMRSDAGTALLTEQSPDQETTESLVGMSVVNNEGEEIGDIKDLVFNDGQIAGAIVSVGGFLGIGAKEVGVSWSAMTVEEREGEKVALVDLTRAELEAAPAFERYEPAPPAGTGGTGGTGTMSPGTGGTTGTTN